MLALATVVFLGSWHSTKEELGTEFGAAESDSFTSYFVSSDGNDEENDGLDEAHPFKTIAKAVEAIGGSNGNEIGHFKVWVKAGLYQETKCVVIPKHNVVIEGYRNIIGDINPSLVDDRHRLGDSLDASRMPLLRGNNSDRPPTGPGIAFFAATKRNIVFRNLQIENYLEGGIRTSGVNRATFENIVIASTTSATGGQSAGAGLSSVGNNCKLRYCTVVNSWGNNIGINGDDNLAEYCASVCDENATDNGTDYYFLVNGNDNRINSSRLLRTHQGRHGGHGFMIQRGRRNIYNDCESTGVSEGVQVLALRGPAENNTFRSCTFNRGSVVLSTQANDNSFVDCEILGGGAGVRFWRSYPANNIFNGLEHAAARNLFQRCTFDDLTHCISFEYGPDRHPWGEPATDNVFEDCNFMNSHVLVRTARPNTGTRFQNSKFSKILHFHADEGTTGDGKGVATYPEPLGPFDKPEFDDDCVFSGNGFLSPVESGRTLTAPANLDYPVLGDIHSGLIAHFKFDETRGRKTVDSITGIRGTLEGNARLRAAGRLGGCISLDGDGDFVNCGDVLDLADEEAGVVTIAAWIKPEREGGGIVSKLASDGGYFFTLNQSYQLAGFTRLPRVDGKNVESQHGTYKTRIPNDKWYHVAVVFDSDSKKMHFYVDGILRESGGAVGRAGSGASFLIGRYSEYFFQGRIDDLRIYNRGLDDLDARKLFRFR